MKLCFVSSHAPGQAAAAAVRAESFARALSRDYQVDFLTPSAAKRSSIDTGFRLVSFGGAGDSPETSLIRRAGWRLRSGLQIAQHLLVHRYDVVFVSSPPFAYAIVVAIVTALRNTRMILDIRDLYPDALVVSGVLSRATSIIAALHRLERFAYHHADAISTVTASLQAAIRHRCLCSPVWLVPNGVSLKHFPLRSRLRVSAYPTAVTHGTLGRFQSITFLIDLATEAAKAGFPLRIEVYGTGKERKALMSAVERNGLQDRVTVHGAVAHSDVPGVLERADFGISARTDDPISRGALPVRMFEHLSGGLPVIVSPAGEASHAATEGGAGRGFRPEQAREAVSWMMSLSEDPSVYARYSANAMNLAAQYDRDALAGSLADRLRALFATSDDSRRLQ